MRYFVIRGGWKARTSILIPTTYFVQLPILTGLTVCIYLNICYKRFLFHYMPYFKHSHPDFLSTPVAPNCNELTPTLYPFMYFAEAAILPGGQRCMSFVYNTNENHVPVSATYTAEFCFMCSPNSTLVWVSRCLGVFLATNYPTNATKFGGESFVDGMHELSAWYDMLYNIYLTLSLRTPTQQSTHPSEGL